MNMVIMGMWRKGGGGGCHDEDNDGDEDDDDDDDLDDDANDKLWHALFGLCLTVVPLPFQILQL